MGAKVITISGPDGYIYDPDGISGEKIDYMLELRASGNDIVAPYAEKYPGATFVEGKRPWEVKADIALPCATQNELKDVYKRQQIVCVSLLWLALCYLVLTKAERIDGMTIVMLVISAALVFIPVYKSMKKNK